MERQKSQEQSNLNMTAAQQTVELKHEHFELIKNMMAQNGINFDYAVECIKTQLQLEDKRTVKKERSKVQQIKDVISVQELKCQETKTEILQEILENEKQIFLQKTSKVTARGLARASFTHMKLIVTGKIKYFKLSEITYVTVPNLPEFNVNKYAKKYIDDQRIWPFIPEMIAYRQTNEDQIETEEIKELIIKDRSFFFNVVNTIYKHQVSDQLKSQRFKRQEDKKKKPQELHIAPEFQDIFIGENPLVGGKGRTVLCLRNNHAISSKKKKKNRKKYSL